MNGIVKRLRFSDLKERRIFNNRPSLKNAIDKYGFPEGQLTGPNTRTWGEDEVQAYIDSRPTARKPRPVRRAPAEPRAAE